MVELRQPIENIKTPEDIQKLGENFQLLEKLQAVKVTTPLTETGVGEGPVKVVPETESLIKPLPEEELKRLEGIAIARQNAKLNELNNKVESSNATVAKVEQESSTPQKTEVKAEEKSKRVFDPADIQDVILSMVKETEFEKTYTIFDGIAITFKMASDADIKFFNDEQYRKLTNSKKELKKIYYQVPEIKEELLKSVGPTNPQLAATIAQILQTPVSEEVYVYTPPNTFRESALDELALHIVRIGNESFEGLSNKEKSDKLSTYNYKFVDYLFASPLAHFRELIGEAISKFKLF